MAPRETVRIRAAIDEADTAWNSLQDDINAPSKFGRQNDRSPPVKVYFQIAESINQLKRFSKAFVSPGSGLVSGGCTERLFCEELTDVGECFELERVACGVEEEHGGLFADLALEAYVGLDDEVNFGLTETLCQCFPLFHRK